MKAIAEIQVIPIGAGVSVRAEVKRAKAIKKAKQKREKDAGQD